MVDESSLFDLLQKLENGEGGSRTGELKRRGWLRWEVTEKGKAALKSQEEVKVLETLCPICNGKQFSCASGIFCNKGHGF